MQISLLTEKETSMLVELTARLARRSMCRSPTPARRWMSFTVATEPSAVLDEIRRQKPDSL